MLLKIAAEEGVSMSLDDIAIDELWALGILAEEQTRWERERQKQDG